jgi:molybdopterin converting factor small subunit
VRIEIRMFMTFKKYLPTGSSEGKAILSVKDGAMVADLLDILDIPPDKPKLVIINGISRGISDAVNTETLNEGDVVAIFPPAAGG